MAGATSPLGNPPLVATEHGGGASTAAARSAGEEGGVETRRNTCATENNNNNKKKYTRHGINDATEWIANNRKCKDPPLGDNEPAPTQEQESIKDPRIAHIEAEEAQRYYDRWHVPRLGHLMED